MGMVDAFTAAIVTPPASGQAADQNNISRIVSWEIDNGARHGEMVQSN
jgi:hypothetical protein